MRPLVSPLSRFVIVGIVEQADRRELKTAEKTIKVHRGRVMQKLGLTSVPELVRLSQTAGVLPAPLGMGLKSTIHLRRSG